MINEPGSISLEDINPEQDKDDVMPLFELDDEFQESSASDITSEIENTAGEVKGLIQKEEIIPQSVIKNKVTRGEQRKINKILTVISKKGSIDYKEQEILTSFYLSNKVTLQEIEKVVVIYLSNIALEVINDLGVNEAKISNYSNDIVKREIYFAYCSHNYKKLGVLETFASALFESLLRSKHSWKARTFGELVTEHIRHHFVEIGSKSK